MDSSNQSSSSSLLMLLLLFTGLLYLIIYSATFSNPLPSAYQSRSQLLLQSVSRSCKHWYQHDCSPDHPESLSSSTSLAAAAAAEEKDELEIALEKASMTNKTVIIAVVNKAYVEQSIKSETTMLDLFLESFWLGEETRELVEHLLVVGVDQRAYERCMFKRLHCYKLETEGVDFGGEKIYMSEDFVKMMWRRTRFLLDVLKRGYSFIFTDVDVMWLRNPFWRLSRNESEDLQISTDWFNGDMRSESNLINTGFYFVRSNNKTISLFQTWYGLRNHSNSTAKKEQDVLLDLTRSGIFRRLDLNAIFLDTLYFSGFCTDSNDIRVVTTVHANCCRSITAKLIDLATVLRDWKRFKVYSTNPKVIARNLTVPFRWTGHFGCRKSWH